MSMMRSVSYELKRAFESIWTKTSLLIGCLIVILDLGTFYQQYDSPGNKILIQAWIGTDFQFAYNSLFYVVFPIIACLPYAGSYYLDIKSGYDKNICIRISRKQYLIAKCIAVYLSAFFCIVVPLLINLFITAGLYPNNPPEKLDFLSAGIIDCHRFPVLFSETPLIYILIFIFLDGVFAGALGMMSLAVTRFCKSQFSVVIIPFVLYIVTGVIMVGENGHSISVMEMINPIQRYITTVEEMCLVFFVIISVSILIIWITGKKRDLI